MYETEGPQLGTPSGRPIARPRLAGATWYRLADPAAHRGYPRFAVRGLLRDQNPSWPWMNFYC
jgi:hypothetical protein